MNGNKIHGYTSTFRISERPATGKKPARVTSAPWRGSIPADPASGWRAAARSADFSYRSPQPRKPPTFPGSNAARCAPRFDGGTHSHSARTLTPASVIERIARASEPSIVDAAAGARHDV